MCTFVYIKGQRIPISIFFFINKEHQRHTDLTLVGLQVWRGALLLADYILYNRKLLKNKTILELGSGVGLTGIVGAIYAKHVICTDINYGGILELIQNNIERNSKIICNKKVDVMELNFKHLNWSPLLMSTIIKTDIIIAADVIYDDDLTDAFVQTIQKLFDTPWANDDGSKYVLVALEKRYVFTLTDLDSSAPSFEYFRQRLASLKLKNNQKYILEYVPCDFPQYFEYERIKELVLMKISL